MKTISLISTVTLLFCALSASADTVIEFKYNNTKSQLLTNGKMARINSRGNDDYMIVDFNTGTVFSVIPKDKQITNLSSLVPSISGFETPEIRLDIKAAGPGPVIAGYKTKQYRLSSGGEICGTVFASVDALNGSTIEQMFGALKTLADSHLESLGGFAMVLPQCDLAKIRLVEKLRYIGAPMRIVDTDGNTESEISKIIKQAGVNPNDYAFPPSYRMVSMDERIDHVLSRNTQTESKPKSRAEIQYEIRELRRKGMLTPDEKEQLKQYRAMLRRK
ncbi:MAG: hypothetical protein KJP10_01805 [Gammaproteobacteria bacterium]|nr:hypothetical protein [Gammaproteobacteria bacterium]